MLLLPAILQPLIAEIHSDTGSTGCIAASKTVDEHEFLKRYGISSSTDKDDHEAPQVLPKKYQFFIVAYGIEDWRTRAIGGGKMSSLTLMHIPLAFF